MLENLSLGAFSHAENEVYQSLCVERDEHNGKVRVRLCSLPTNKYAKASVQKLTERARLSLADHGDSNNSFGCNKKDFEGLTTHRTGVQSCYAKEVSVRH